MEFVRVKLNSEAFLNNQNTVEGSRASAKNDWHTVYYLKRNSAGNLVADTTRTSSSAPLVTGTGNGTAAVTSLPGAVTEGFTATYNAGAQRWDVTGTSGDTANVAVGGAVPAGTTWTVTVGNKVRVVITQGATAFAGGDQIVFSVFKTGDARGKGQSTSASAYTVTGTP